MATLKETALAYEQKHVLNIADLESFDVSEPIFIRTGKDEDGKDYSYFVLIRDEEEYRVPNGVMNDIKNLITANAKHEKEVNTFSVEKTGEGLKTRYSIITLD